MKSRSYFLRIFLGTVSFLVFLSVMPDFLCARSRKRTERVRWVRVRGGIGVLRDLAKNMKEIESDLAGETQSYESVRKALDEGHLYPGMPARDISEKCGEALLAMREDSTERTRRVYKPAEATYFRGPKIYLYFDDEDRLTGWEEVN